MTTTREHPFARAGLGVPPFRFVGCYEDVGPHKMPDGSECGAPGQPMGCCAYCGQGIKVCCVIKDANGKTFTVGSDCVAKTASEGAGPQDPVVRAVKHELAKQRREKNYARFLKEREELKAFLPRLEEICKSQPHPWESLAAKGLTLFDYYEWQSRNAMAKGTHAALKAARRLLAEKESTRCQG